MEMGGMSEGWRWRGRGGLRRGGGVEGRVCATRPAGISCPHAVPTLTLPALSLLAAEHDYVTPAVPSSLGRTRASPTLLPRIH